MKIVGLKIEKGRLAVSVVDKGLRHTALEASFVVPFSTDAELADILREKSRDWAGARIISSIPGSRFSQRTVSLPFGDRKRVEKALPFEVEDGLPFPFDDVVLDHLVLDNEGEDKGKKKEADVVGMMIPKTVLQQHLDLLLSAGVDPQFVIPSYVGLQHVARMIPVEGAAVLIDGSDLCLKDGSAVKVCRSFTAVRPTGGIRHTLKALETEYDVQIERAYLLSAADGLGAELADAGLTVEQVSPEFHGEKPEDPVSLGLALSEDVNFRKGAFAYRIVDEGARRRRRTLLIAGAFAVVFAAANIGLKFYLVETNYRRLDREIKELYHRTVPDAKAIVDPLRQLRTRLEDARKKYGVLGSGASALDIMKTVTEGIPKEVSVTFTDFLLEGDRLKLAGDAASFESVDKIKAELQKAAPFADVQVQDTRMGADNKVKFRLDIKLKQSM